MTGGVKGRRDGENIISRLYLHQIGRPDTRRRCDEHARAPVDGAATNNPDVVARIVRSLNWRSGDENVIKIALSVARSATDRFGPVALRVV